MNLIRRYRKLKKENVALRKKVKELAAEIVKGDNWILVDEELPEPDTPLQVIISEIGGGFRVSIASFDLLNHQNNLINTDINLQRFEWLEDDFGVDVAAWRPLPEIPEWVKVHYKKAQEEYCKQLLDR